MACEANSYIGAWSNSVPWKNWSEYVDRTLPRLFIPQPALRRPSSPRMPPQPLPPLVPPPFDGLPQFVRVAVDATTNGNRLHALGSGWAYEDLAAGDDWTVETNHVRQRILSTVGPTSGASRPRPPGLNDAWAARQLAANSTQLVHVEAGMTVGQLIDVLAADGLALPTVGGANGQTIAGVINTSTHGGDWDQPPFPDLVRAMHLVTDAGREVWIEPESAPITDDQHLLPTLACPTVAIVRSDEIFNAALVGLGRFGIVYSYVLEVGPAFSVAEFVTQPSRSDVVSVLRQGLADASPFDRLFALLAAKPPPNGLLDPGTGTTPYFWQLIFNSLIETDLWVQRRWIVKQNTSPIPGQPANKTDGGLATFGLNALGALGLGAVVGHLATGVFGAQFAIGMTTGVRGPHGLVTSGTAADSANITYKAESMEVVFDARDGGYLDFLDAVQPHAEQLRQSGYITVRPCRSSAATLSMHNVASDYAISIELTSMNGLPDNAAYMDFIHTQALAHRGRPHWGQINFFDTPTVRQLYGEQLASWARALFAVSGTSTVFSTAYSRRCGLEPRVALSQIDVTVPAPDQLLVAATGPGRTDFWGPNPNGGYGWNAWEAHELTSPQAAGQVAVVTESGRSMMVKVGADGWIYHCTRAQDRSWSGWGIVGRSNEREFLGVPGGPVHTVSARADSVHALYANRDGWVVSSRADTSGGATTWPETVRVRGGLTVPGGHITGVSRRAGQLDIFTVGRDGVVCTAAWNSQQGWAGWWPLYGIFAPPGAPVGAVSRSLDHLDIFVAQVTGETMATAWAPGPAGWQPWTSIRSGKTAPGGQIMGVCRSVDQIDVFVAGTDRGIYTASWNPANQWAGWWPIGANQAAEPGAAVVPVSRSADLIDAFYVDAAGVVQTVGWSPANGWGGPWLVT